MAKVINAITFGLVTIVVGAVALLAVVVDVMAGIQIHQFTEGAPFPFLWVIAALVGSFVAVFMVVGYKKELFVRK